MTGLLWKSKNRRVFFGVHSEGAHVLITLRTLIPVPTDPEMGKLPLKPGEGVKDRFELSKPRFGKMIMKTVLYLHPKTALCICGTLNNAFEHNENGITSIVAEMGTEWTVNDAKAPAGMPAKIEEAK